MDGDGGSQGAVTSTLQQSLGGGLYTKPTAAYANRVEVQRGKVDAVLRFYRDHGQQGRLIQEITVPLPVLDDLTPKKGKR